MEIRFRCLNLKWQVNCNFFIYNRLSDTYISWYRSICSHMRTMSQTLQNTTADTVFKFFVQWKIEKGHFGKYQTHSIILYFCNIHCSIEYIQQEPIHYIYSAWIDHPVLNTRGLECILDVDVSHPPSNESWHIRQQLQWAIHSQPVFILLDTLYFHLIDKISTRIYVLIAESSKPSDKILLHHPLCKYKTCIECYIIHVIHGEILFKCYFNPIYQRNNSRLM